VNTLCVCSAKALSKYTEMVDNVIRQQKDKLEAASDEARLRLREWDMPEALQASHTPITVLPFTEAPASLLHEAAMLLSSCFGACQLCGRSCKADTAYVHACLYMCK